MKKLKLSFFNISSCTKVIESFLPQEFNIPIAKNLELQDGFTVMKISNTILLIEQENYMAEKNVIFI